MTLSRAINRAAAGDSGFFRMGLSAGPRYAFNPASAYASGEQVGVYDYADISTLFQNAARTIPVTAFGQVVLGVTDKSGRGLHLSSTNGPTYASVTLGSGRVVNGLQFNGTSNFLVSPTITPGTSKAQAFIGLRKTEDAATSIPIEFGPNVNSTAGTFAIAKLSSVFRARSRGASATVDMDGATSAAPNNRVVSGIFDTTAPVVTIRENGVLGSSNTASQGGGNYSAQQFFVGSRAGTSLFMAGFIFRQVVGFGSNLTAAQIAQIEEWVNAGTGAY